MPSKLDRDAAKALEKAVELMNDSGAHWQQNGYISDFPMADGKPAYCALGAIQAATIGWRRHSFFRSDDKLIIHTAQALADAYRRPNSVGSSDPLAEVVEWNDASETTWEKVRARFIRARNRLLKN